MTKQQLFFFFFLFVANAEILKQEAIVFVHRHTIRVRVVLFLLRINTVNCLSTLFFFKTTKLGLVVLFLDRTKPPFL